MRQRKLIGASELGDFVYCQRSWWLRRVRQVPVNRATRVLQVEGERWHEAQGQRIAAPARSRNMGILLLLAAIVLALFWLWGVAR